MRIDTSSPIPMYLQVEQLIEQLILKSDLSPHELVPGVAVLAKELKVGALTVQKAFRRLQERGLIYSIAGKGTFVAEVKSHQFVGVLVHNQFIIDAAQTPTPALLVQAISEELARQKLSMRLLTDTNPRIHAMAPVSADVMSTLEHGRPSGLILVGHGGSEAIRDYVAERSIPVVGLHADYPHASAEMWFENQDLLHAGLCHLKRRGIDDVGVLWLDVGNGPVVRRRQVESFAATFERAEMHANLDWIIGVHQASDWAGYHAFNHLCDLSRRPRGLIVLDDVIGRGVHVGVLARQLNVPDDLAIVMHANQDSPIHFPSHWNLLGYHLKECGQLAVQAMQKLLHGEKLAGRTSFPWRWHQDPAVSPWSHPAEADKGENSSRTLFRSGRQALESTAI